MQQKKQTMHLLRIEPGMVNLVPDSSLPNSWEVDTIVVSTRI